MNDDSRAIGPDDFLTVAVRQSLLTPDQLSDLSREASERGIDAAALVQEKGLLSPAQTEIVDGLSHPRDVAPGFELLDVLGHGGLGVVYRARQPKLDRVVALKTIPLGRMNQPGIVGRFEQEAKVVGRLHHPHIVAAYDYGTHKGRLYLAMELVDGTDLESRLRKAGPLGETVTWGVIRQVAAGLQHAAQLEIVHRDIKPANLLLTAPPAGASLPAGVPLVKIVDFGLARLQGHDQDDVTRLTMDGSTVGTPQYMAPEQLTAANVDHRADMYALGATAYHMLTGQPPFRGKTMGEILAQKARGELPPVEPLSDRAGAASVALVQQMMAADPSNRIADYGELIDQIDRLCASASLPDAAAPTDVTLELPATPRRASRLRSRLLMLVAAVGGMGVTAWLVLWVIHGTGQLDGNLAANWGRSGWQQSLYDGRTLNGWSGIRGTWAFATDAEGGQVLSGEGSIVRPIPAAAGATRDAPENYGVSLGVDLNDADTVEVIFGDEATADGSGSVVLTADAAVLGRTGVASGGFQPTTPAMPLPDAAAGSPSYHQLRIERHGTAWSTYLNGQLVGLSPATGERAGRTIRLIARGGKAHFEGLTVYEMVPLADPALD